MTALDTDVRSIKGIGEERAKALNKLGITTLSELVSDFPRAYDDRSVIKETDELIVGESVCVVGTVATAPTLSHIRRGLDLVKLRVFDARGTMNVTFFNQSYVRNQLHPGESYVFYGRVGGKIGQPEMTNPIFEPEESARVRTGQIVPVYRLTAGLSQNMMINAVKQGLRACGDVLPDPLPNEIKREYQLAQSRFAYENIHFPQSYEALEIARNRLIFEEFFVLSCALERFRAKKTQKTGFAITPAKLDDFKAILPFTLTGAQERAINDIYADMAKPAPMSRLVQGDVGSGKTAVAAAACWNAVSGGYQAAFMAPTEILAEQHYETLGKLLTPLGVRTVLLTGGIGAKARRETLRAIESGEAQLIIGTHALISGDVQYAKLGLVVADEQHRFGVTQRAALTEKGESPHVLVMSATPIPRTLALIVYGDLDVSVLNELPPGRQKVDTFAVNESMRKRINAFIAKQIDAGRQVFIVCPAVEENTEEHTDELKNVKAYTKELKTVFPQYNIGLIHGKMKPKEKNEIMTAFASGEVNILVATTVVEVGVDVPNATLMIVENADRFGLSQLHQLRGRVGRGKEKSYCVLFNSSGSDSARERLKAMCDTNDGFKIAEEDLRMRGPGDFFGSRQHGLPEMQIASFATDMELLKKAQTAAKNTLSADPELSDKEHAELKKAVLRLIEKNEGTLN